MVKVFQKKVKFQGQGHESKIMVPCERSCHKEYTSAISKPYFLIRKLWPRLKFFKSRSNFKVKVTRSKIMVPCERSCHKEYTCAI